nr:helix-turn-helix transcriptional regulator [Desulfuromonas sp. TF]
MGKRIVEARKNKGMTAETLGVMIGLSKGAIWKIENDQLKGGPDPETVVRISEALNDTSILLHYLEENPVYKSIIPKIFPDLNNIRRDPAIIFGKFRREASEAIDAAEVLEEIFSRTDPRSVPNFDETFKAKLEQIVDVERCSQEMFFALIAAGIMTEEDRKEIHRRQQEKCERNGHHKPPTREASAAKA